MSTPISTLKNLGAASEFMLREIDVFCAEDLKRMGYMEAYLRLKFRFPKQINLLMLYALYGALHNMHWNKIPPTVKARLKESVKNQHP